MEHLPTDTPLLRISDVTAATGIPCTSLRAWERRYGFPETVRTQGGQRLYSMEQVDDLRRLRELIDSGLAVSQAVCVLRGHHPLACAGTLDGEVKGALYDALVAMRRDQADQILSAAGGSCPVDVLLEDLLVPVMRQIGEDWQAGAVGIEQEHFASSWAREWLILQAQTVTTTGRERLLLACVEGERHELGLLALQLELRRAGFETLHLGADVPTAALLGAVRRYRPRVVMLSVSLPARLPLVSRVVAEIEAIPEERRPRVAYGGCGACATTALPGADWLGPTARDAVVALGEWL